MIVACRIAALLLALAAVSDEPRRPLPPAEFGRALTAEDARAGWIALFDGKTDFGWSGAKVEGASLAGGRTNAEFGPLELRAEVVSGGDISVGQKAFKVHPGNITLRAEDGRGPVVLGPGTAVRSLAARPLGLEPLFNGRDLTGWKALFRPYIPEQDRAVWAVEDGAIHAKGGKGALEYQKQRLGDFILQLDVYCVADEANGGVFFRNIPGDAMNGYEAQILNRCEDGDPSRPLGYGTGGIDDRLPARRLVSRDRQWFTMTVLAAGPHLATWVNGCQVTDWTDRRPPQENARHGLRLKPGTLQLQSHDPATDILFKNLRAAPLQ